jgi:hypothetical protein
MFWHYSFFDMNMTSRLWEFGLLSQKGIKNLHMMNLQRRPVLSNRVSTRSTSDPPMRGLA